jgi:hypothetical protein
MAFAGQQRLERNGGLTAAIRVPGSPQVPAVYASVVRAQEEERRRAQQPQRGAANDLRSSGEGFIVQRGQQ